jgi:hypothetical protein
MNHKFVISAINLSSTFKAELVLKGSGSTCNLVSFSDEGNEYPPPNLESSNQR